MKVLMIVMGILLYVLFCLFMWSLCVAASRADDMMEQDFQRWLLENPEKTLTSSTEA